MHSYNLLVIAKFVVLIVNIVLILLSDYTASSYIQYQNQLNCTNIFRQYGLNSGKYENQNFKSCSETFQDEYNGMLCQDEYIAGSDSLLNCFYQHRKHPFLTIAPFKVEKIHKDPDIFIYHNILTNEEIGKLMLLTKDKMETSQTVSKNGDPEVTPHRKSMTAYLDEDENEMKNLLQRISDAATISLDFAENLQVAKYETGGYYKTHLDSFTDQKQLRHGKGNRMATFLMYLNDVNQGGYTVFPILKLHIKPQKGAGILWYNIFDNGVNDLRMLHGACPVLEGIKWVSTKWIREKGQELICPRDIEKSKRERTKTQKLLDT